MNKAKFLKITMTYFLGNILTKILTFLLIPIYTKYLSTEMFGYYDLSVSVITLVIPIIFFQIWDGMFRFIYDYKEQKDKQKIITNGMLISLVGCVLYAIGIIGTQIITNKINYGLYIYFYGISIGFQYIYGTIARTGQRNQLYMVSGVINTCINLMCNIVLITVFKLGIVSLYISQILGNFVQIIIIEYKLKIGRKIKFQDLSKNLMKEMILFSMPIAITTISTWLLTGYARVIISAKLGMNYNGIFAIATRFSTVITLVVSVLQMSWQELSYSIVTSNNKNRYYENGLQRFYNMITCGTILVMSITQVIFDYFVSNEYQQAKEIMPIVYLYTAFNAFAGFLSTQFLAEKNSKVTFYSVLISALTNIVIIQLLINKYELLGVTISLLISFALNMIIRMYLLYKKYKISLKKKYILFSILIIAIYMLIYYTNIKLINLISFLIAGVIASFIFRRDIKEILLKITKIVKGKLIV